MLAGHTLPRMMLGNIPTAPLTLESPVPPFESYSPTPCGARLFDQARVTASIRANVGTPTDAFWP